MKKLEVTDAELRAAKLHFEGKINPALSPIEDLEAIDSLITKAEELEAELGEAATDEIFKDPECDIIRWYLKKWRKQQREQDEQSGQ